MDIATGFVEIDFQELDILTIVGRGAFGVVSRGKWRGIDVAIKLIQTESEQRAFTTELKQLSRVSHPNIVKLYGACTKNPVCLVMEYAEGGSVYNVLHGVGLQESYTVAHTMSWCLQCAKGVEYLHGMKPKALIHRDLKPPNLLLIRDGTELKICDFGTACDAQTHMTNNKGSAAWMAPEVFEGSNYSEKCDVYSWGIILWEVLTRRKPFDECNATAYMILWAVHQGKRPPLINNCPKPIESLMTKCWSKQPLERPSMREVVRVMTHLCKFFSGADQPLGQPQGDGSSSQLSTQSSREASAQTIQQTVRDLVRTQLGETVPLQLPPTPKAKPIVVEESSCEGGRRRTSAPASLATSHESLLSSSRCSTPSGDASTGSNRYSADFSHFDHTDMMAAAVANKPTHPGLSHRRSGSYGNAPLTAGMPLTEALPAIVTPSTIHHSTTAPADLNTRPTDNPFTFNTGLATGMPAMASCNQARLELALIDIDQHLQPLLPCTTNKESMDIYHEHMQLAQEKMRVQAEIALLTQRKNELTKQLQQDALQQQSTTRFREEYQHLINDNEELELLYKNLKRQVEQTQLQRNI